MAVWLLWLLLLYVISSSLKEMPDFTQIATPPPWAIRSRRTGGQYPGKVRSVWDAFSGVTFVSVTIAISGLCWCKQCWKSPILDIIPKAFVSRILRRRELGLKGAACGLRGNMEIYGGFCGSKIHGRILITSGKKSSLRNFSVHFSLMLMSAQAVPKALRDGKIRRVATLTPPCTQWFTSTSAVHSTSDVANVLRVSRVLFLSAPHWVFVQSFVFFYCGQETSSHRIGIAPWLPGVAWWGAAW